MKKWLVRTAIVVVSLVALVSVLVLAAWSLTGFGSAAAMANDQYRAWQKNGLPITQDEVVQSPPPAQEDNAAELIKEAGLLLEKNERDIREIKFGEEAAYRSGKMKSDLAKQAEVLTLARRASQKSSFRIAHDWDDQDNAIFESFSTIKGLAKLLVAQAELDAREGRGEAMVADIRAARKLAVLCSQEPTMIADLVAISIDAIVMAGAARCASLVAEDRQVLTSLEGAINSTNWAENWEAIFRAEAYCSLAYYRNATNKQFIDELNGRANHYDEDSPSIPREIVRTGLPSQHLPRAVSAEMMSYWNEFYPRIKTPNPDLDTLFADMQKRGLDYDQSSSLAKKLAGMSVAMYEQARQSQKRRVSGDRATIAYIKMLQFRAESNRWPKDLAEAGVKGAAAVDEIDGQPLRYRVDGASARVWHVGNNGIDDGGVTRAEAQVAKTRADDGAWIYPWPKPLR